MRFITSTAPSTSPSCPRSSIHNIYSCNLIQTAISKWSPEYAPIKSRPRSRWQTRTIYNLQNTKLRPSPQAIVNPLAHDFRDSESWLQSVETQRVNGDRDLPCFPSLKKNSDREIHGGEKNHLLDMSHANLLKVALIFGSLSLQAAEPAFAASDFAGGSLSTSDFFGDFSDISTGFASAFLIIFFSELGDKTFFIAAILAARNSGTIVFTGTFGALVVMTVISVIIGRTFHYIDGILPFRFGGTDLPIDDIAAVFLLVYFGVSTLIDAASSDGLQVEDEQKEAELAVSKFSGNGAGILSAASTIISTFVLVFIAEWGDKSFFSTVALAAASSPLGVIGGSVAAHGVATLIAVIGGSLLGTFLSEKVIAYTGGVLFLFFGGLTLLEIING